MKKTLEKKENLFTKSILLRLIRRFVVFVYLSVINGFFGRLFTSYSSVEKSFDKSFLVKKIGKESSKRGVAGKLKRAVAQSFENSRIIGSFSKTLSDMLFGSLKEYGAFFLVLGFGSLSLVTFRCGRFIQLLNEIPSVVTCGAFIVLGVSFLMSKKRLSEALCESQVMSSLLFEAFGIQKDLLNEQKGNRNRVYLLPVLFGLCFAALSYFVMPVWIAFAGLSLLAVLLILLFPELGVLVLMAVIPLASFVSHPSVLLLLLVGVTLFSYIVKLIRGKRVFKMKAVDFAVAGFAVIRLSSGFFAAGGSAALVKAVVDCGLLCAYFPVVNLMRSKEWLNRAKYTFLIFAAVAVLIGAFQSFGGGYESGWLDSSAFSEISVRVTSTFGNPNVFASYILLVLPFAAGGVIEKNKPRHKIMLIFTLLLAVLCLVQTWSRGAWLGACVAAVVFAFVYSHKTVPCVFAVGITAILALPLVFPNISQRFVSIGNFAESSVSYRISAWQGILNMLKGNWIGGIGYGEASFSAVYPSFAYSGAESVRHSHSLYLQILTESGIIGLLAFGITVFLFLQNCFEYLYRVKEKEAGYMMIAGISAVVGFLVMGLADYVWYNSGILLAFWLTVALVNASVRVGISEMERYNESKINTELSMDIEVGLNNFQ